jgi:hypothetical protein
MGRWILCRCQRKHILSSTSTGLDCFQNLLELDLTRSKEQVVYRDLNRIPSPRKSSAHISYHLSVFLTCA